MSHNPPKPNDIIVIDGDDISHLSPIITSHQGFEEVTGFKIILKPRYRRDVCSGLRISTKEAMKIILGSMRGKRFEAVKAIKWHYIGRETKAGRTDMVTYTKDSQRVDALADKIADRLNEE